MASRIKAFETFPIAYPITLPMCAPVSTRAAAAILCTEDGLRHIGGDRSRCIRGAASVIRSVTHRRVDEPKQKIGRLIVSDGSGLGRDER